MLSKLGWLLITCLIADRMTGVTVTERRGQLWWGFTRLIPFRTSSSLSLFSRGFLRPLMTCKPAKYVLIVNELLWFGPCVWHIVYQCVL